MYHRVGTSTIDPWGLSVSAENFRQQIDCLRAVTNPVPLCALPDAARDSSKTPAVSVTFDDGYIDNLTVAGPILVERAVPATVFVATGYMDRRREFWWDELVRLLLQPAELPIKTAMGDLPFTDLERCRLYTQAHRASDRDWFLSRQGTTSARLELFLNTHRWLMQKGDTERSVVLDGIARWVGDRGIPREEFMCCRREDLQRLDAIEGIELGAHTVTHPLLSALSVCEQVGEVARSHSELEQLLGRRVETFSYPYGDVTDAAKSCLRDLDVRFACSTRPGLVMADSDHRLLPRFKVGDWDGETFAQKLSGWLLSP